MATRKNAPQSGQEGGSLKRRGKGKVSKKVGNTVKVGFCHHHKKQGYPLVPSPCLLADVMARVDTRLPPHWQADVMIGGGWPLLLNQAERDLGHVTDFNQSACRISHFIPAAF